MKKSSYLSERVYDAIPSEINMESLEYWKKILKEEGLQYVKKNHLEYFFGFINNCAFSSHEKSQPRNFVKLSLNKKAFRHEGEKMVFGAFYDPFVQEANRQLREIVIQRRYINESILFDFQQFLFNSLNNLCIRTLIYEMHICGQEGVLRGNESEQYQYYIDHFLKDKQYLNDLFSLYPVLERRINEIIQNAIDIYKEVIYHDRKYHKICEVLDNRLLRYIDTISEGEQNIEDFNTGIFSGEGSILYTLGILYEIYDDIKYKEYFDKWLNCMETLILEDRLFDMISGNSGIVLVLINMYRKTKKPIYLQKAIQIAEQLIENMITENGKVGWKSEVVPEVLAGFAHGNSGFIELFSRLYEVYPQTKYLDILSSLVEYENSLYSEKDNNWIDLRKFSEVDQHKSQPIAWCHGAAGILLSRLTLYNAIKNLGETALLQQAIKDISLAKNKLIEDGLHAGFCLCHGNMGNLLILKRYAEIFDDKQVRSICDSRFEQILEFLNEENILPTELYNPGFMTGLSGIAYALLKYKMPKLPLLIGV